MAQSMVSTVSTDDFDRLQQQVLLTTAVLGASYAGFLAVLERALPIKPAWVALEVIGGVLLVSLPVSWLVRKVNPSLTWKDYERLIMAGFVGAGLPISLWQALEYGVLQRR